MPSKRKRLGQKQWRARVKVKGKEVFLGNFPSREAARKEEDLYRRREGLKPMPQRRNSKAG